LTTCGFFFLFKPAQPFRVFIFRYFPEFGFPSYFAISFAFRVLLAMFNVCADLNDIAIVQEAARSLSFEESLISDASDLSTTDIPGLARRVQVILEIASRR